MFYSSSGVRWGGLPYRLIAIINTATKQHLGDIRVDSVNIQAMPIEPGTGPKKMYAALADNNQIAVIDLDKRTVLTTWPTTPECQAPMAAAVDTAHHRLFVGCRMYATQPDWWLPGRMIVMNTDTGKMIAQFPAVGGSDERFFDAESQRIYLQGYECIAVGWKKCDPDHYLLLRNISSQIHCNTPSL